MSENHELSRFLEAQEDIYPKAVEELKNGQKESHWMWFIFPQFAGLGSSSTSQRFAIKSLHEARAYLAHPVLGTRLVECAEVLLAVEGHTAQDIFGSPDDLKLRSSATLFACVSPAGSRFDQLLAKYFDGERDGKTLELAGLKSDGR
jgi:uncharacterized protein (DUF1810 family)